MTLRKFVRATLWHYFASKYGRSDPLLAFLKATVRRLGAEAEYHSKGHSRVASFTYMGQSLVAGCSAEMWVQSSLAFESFPSTAAVRHSPIGSYSRAKDIEFHDASYESGRPDFDSEFVVLAEFPEVEAAAFRALPEIFVSALVAASSLRPSLLGSAAARDTPDEVGRVVLRTYPDWRSFGYWLGPVPGLGGFSETRFADAIRKHAALTCCLRDTLAT